MPTNAHHKCNIKNNHKYQYFIDEVAGLLKSGNKKVVSSHFASKQK